MVERDDFAFKLEVVYEWLPEFCSHCQMIGHDVMTCRWLIPKKVVVDKVDIGIKPNQVVHQPTQKYVEKDNLDGIGSSKSFAVLKTAQEIPVIINDEHVHNTDPVPSDGARIITEEKSNQLTITEEMVGSEKLSIATTDQPVIIVEHVVSNDSQINNVDHDAPRSFDPVIQMVDLRMHNLRLHLIQNQVLLFISH